MALNISKQTNNSSNFSGSSAQSVFAFGFSALEFSGSALFVNTCLVENGTNVDEFGPILKSDSSEQF